MKEAESQSSRNNGFSMDIEYSENMKWINVFSNQVSLVYKERWTWSFKGGL